MNPAPSTASPLRRLLASPARPVVTGFVLLLLLGGCSGQRSLQAIHDSGDRAFEAGNYELARAEYTEFVDRRPGKAEVHYALGRTYLAMGQPREAVQHLSTARDLKPLNMEYAEVLAEALFEAGDHGTLYTFLREMIHRPGRVEDYLRFGYYAALMGDADEAHNAYRTAARIDGGQSAVPQVALAGFYNSIGQKDQALERLRMALYIEPHNPEIAAKIRELGEIPGPSLALEPAEARDDF